jgi:hypothetical protein
MKTVQNSLLAVIQTYINQGYTDHFRIRPDGYICCLSRIDKLYDLDEVEHSLIISEQTETNIYLIKTRDGLFKGIALECRNIIL